MRYNYYVTAGHNGDEYDLLKTDDLQLAIIRAKYESINPFYDFVEIRHYWHNIEDEDCNCFDHNTIEY